MRTVHFFLTADSLSGLSAREREVCGRNDGLKPLFKRYFLSELSQYAGAVQENGAVSYIIQPPLRMSASSSRCGSVVLWMMCGEGEPGETELETGYFPGITMATERSAIDGSPVALHLFTAGSADARPVGTEFQTRKLLLALSETLDGYGMSINDNCIRTWFQCADIDRLYAGLVKGRREYFDDIGLTKNTHYLASTGIAGDSPVPGALVQMDSWSVKGGFTQRYLHAPTHLNPTHEYGVTFERGVRVDSAGRAHVIISGTASIDNRGRVVHVGDVYAQAERMLENVSVLLGEAGAGWKDVGQAVIYLRNAPDCTKVERLLSDRLKGIPYVVTLAPVCRPEWLIEMECMAEFRPKPSKGRP